MESAIKHSLFQLGSMSDLNCFVLFLVIKSLLPIHQLRAPTYVYEIYTIRLIQRRQPPLCEYHLTPLYGVHTYIRLKSQFIRSLIHL